VSLLLYSNRLVSQQNWLNSLYGMASSLSSDEPTFWLMIKRALRACSFEHLANCNCFQLISTAFNGFQLLTTAYNCSQPLTTAPNCFLSLSIALKLPPNFSQLLPTAFNCSQPLTTADNRFQPLSALCNRSNEQALSTRPFFPSSVNLPMQMSAIVTQ